ncbi:hypothetical protein CYY_008777 [Polysphondylium violaceum]|uniref:Uncharacterized protein n=1 Tax=Polysphondylium violaceum TaxID=133409 RepID=A0A8J4PNU5_9MYCE|nr:hypothetical protein CYY_008777 [Polysphondylium violaceum]
MEAYLPILQNGNLVDFQNPLSQFLFIKLPLIYKDYSIATSVLIISLVTLNTLFIAFLLLKPNSYSPQSKEMIVRENNNNNNNKTPTKKKQKHNNNNIYHSPKVSNMKLQSPMKLPSQESPTKMNHLESIANLYPSPEKPKSRKSLVKTPSKTKSFLNIDNSPPANPTRRVSQPPTRLIDVLNEEKNKTKKKK